MKVTRGGVKGTAYRHGEPFPKGNTWCLVYVGNSWRLIDQFFGSQSVSVDNRDWQIVASNIGGGYGDREDYKEVMNFSMEEFYFLADPEQFIYDHFPPDPEMQLLARPVVEAEFTQMARLYRKYFDFGIKDLNEPKCKLTNETGQVELSFDTKPDSHLIFKYAIFKHLGNQAKGNIEGEDLKNFVTLENNMNDKGITKILHASFKYIGLYKIEIMAKDAKDDPHMIHMIADYVIDCKRPYFNLEPNPPIPDGLQELGPGADWERLEIEAKQRGGVIQAEDGYAQINLHKNNEDNVEYFFKLESQKISAAVLQCSLMQDLRMADTTLHIKLPSYGNYLLQTYTRTTEETTLQNTCNYLVTSDTRYTAYFFPLDMKGRAGAIGDGKKLLKPITHENAVFDVTSGDDEKLEMLMLVAMDIEITLSMYDNNDVNTDCSEYLWFERQNDTIKCVLRFPKADQYKLVIFTKPTGNKILKESWRYLIDVLEPTKDCVPFPTVTDSWSPNFKLIAPARRPLEENQDVPFEVQIAGMHSL